LSEAPKQVDLQGTYEPIYDDFNSAADCIPDYFLACLHSDRGLLPSLLISPYIDQRKLHLIIEPHNLVLCINLFMQDIRDVEGSSALLSANPKSSPLSTDWLPASRTHPYLYHASVFVCLASTETLAQQPLSPSSYYHRGVAINLINERLGDPMNCCTDETIAAIISLANFEVRSLLWICAYELTAKSHIQCITGNISNLKHHVDGMLQLVDMRGGLDNLGMNGLLKKLIEMYGFLPISSYIPHTYTDSQSDTSGSSKFSPQNPALFPLQCFPSYFQGSPSPPTNVPTHPSTTSSLSNHHQRLLLRTTLEALYTPSSNRPSHNPSPLTPAQP
jgi:hypothetical protein